jgi:hypothetical protein
MIKYSEKWTDGLASIIDNINHLNTQYTHQRSIQIREADSRLNTIKTIADSLLEDVEAFKMATQNNNIHRGLARLKKRQEGGEVVDGWNNEGEAAIEEMLTDGRM